MDFSILTTWDGLIYLVILSLLEIVLGIDNIIFISIVTDKLKAEQKRKARNIGLILALVVRLFLLSVVAWIMGMTKPLFVIMGQHFSGQSIVLLLGGLFLIYKSVKEIHNKLEGEDPNETIKAQKGIGFAQAVAQIMLIDAVFSFDSIITAGGTAKHVEIMIAAVIIAMIVMFLFSPAISSFVHKHPTIKMLALSFLVMIGLSLVIEGWDSDAAHQLHLKNYIYFGMAFSFGVEMLNMAMRTREKKRRAKVVELNEPVLEETKEGYNDMAR